MNVLVNDQVQCFVYFILIDKQLVEVIVVIYIGEDGVICIIVSKDGFIIDCIVICDDVFDILFINYKMFDQFLLCYEDQYIWQQLVELL